MKTYEFTIELTGINEKMDEDDIAEAIYSSGCDDATLSVCNGVFTLDFARVSKSLGEAIQGAKSDIMRANVCRSVITRWKQVV